MNVRLNTGLRAPTGYRAGQISSKLLKNKALTLQERPVTQQGLSGIQSSISGPKRKVFDKSYYIQAYKKKIEGLTNEIVKLRQTKEKRREEESKREKLVERKEELHEEVRGLEAKLADLNLAMDKHRAGTHKEDLVSLFHLGPIIPVPLTNCKENIKEQIEFQNKRLKNQLDGIFIQKKNFEEGLAEVKKKEGELETLARLKVQELGEKGVQEHAKVDKNIHRLRDLINSKKFELEEISFR